MKKPWPPSRFQELLEDHDDTELGLLLSASAGASLRLSASGCCRRPLGDKECAQEEALEKDSVSEPASGDKMLRADNGCAKRDFASTAADSGGERICAPPGG